jgi:RND family efflux transporter MFP subunit
MTYRLIVLLLVAASLFGVFSGVRLVRAQATKPPAPPPLAEPARSPYESSLAATGIIEAARENVSIATSKPGLVTAVPVEVGTQVTKGQPLFQLDDREARARLATLQAQLAVQQAAVAAESALRDDAVDQWKRMEKLLAQRVASDDEANRKRFAVQNLEARLAKAQADLAAFDAQLRQAEVEVEVLTVKAPRDGVILQLNLREGEYAAASPSTPLMILGDVETLQVRADVDEQNAPQVRAGAAATAFLKGTTTTPIPLRFVRIDPFVLPKKSLTGDSSERVDTRVLQIIYRLEKADGRSLYVGQQVDVFLER